MENEEQIIVNKEEPIKPHKEKKDYTALIIVGLIFFAVLIIPYIYNFIQKQNLKKAENEITAKNVCQYKDKTEEITVVLNYGRDKLKTYTKQKITTLDDEMKLQELNNLCETTKKDIKNDRNIKMSCLNKDGKQTITYEINYKKIDEKKYQNNSSFKLDYSKKKSVKEIIKELVSKKYSCS